MTDDAVRERHGVACRDNLAARGAAWITLAEDEQEIRVLASESHGVVLTAWHARYLAAKLYRLSRRIRQRTGE